MVAAFDDDVVGRPSKKGLSNWLFAYPTSDNDEDNDNDAWFHGFEQQASLVSQNHPLLLPPV
mgnify:CR=1 FL=1